MSVHQFPEQVGKGAVVDIQTIADYLGVSVRWVRYRIAEDGFPTRRRDHGRLGFQYAEVDAWVERRSQEMERRR